MDDVWCSLDIAGLQSDLAADPFWQPFPRSVVSSIGGDSNAYFGVADVDLMLSSPDEANNGMAVDMDASGFFGAGGDDDGRFLFQQPSTSSSLSLDSGGSSGSGSFTLDASPYQAPAPAMAHHPFPGDHDDEAIMRAMMAVMSSSASASPSSSASPSASSRPPHPFRRDEAAAMPLPQQLRGGNGGHVMMKSSLAMSPPEKTALPSGGGGRQEDPRAASGNSGQLYHMMSERKRREKLNDSFQTLRSLLPPCSKKDKTTVLTKAAGYLKALEAQVWELEEKNGKLERHIPAAAASQEAPAPQQSRRAKVQISRSEEEVVTLTVMVMVECDVVELVLRVLECLRWMEQISVLSVDADTYSPKVLLKAIASIKLRIMDGCDWNEASFHEVMTKAVNDATSSPPPTTTSLPPCARVPLVVTA